MNRTVLVTGGAKRIGKVICEVLRARGWNVLVHSRDAANPLAADFADPFGPARLFQKACDAAGDLCAIVNNASVFSPAAALPPEAAARMMRINAEAPEKLSTLLGLRLMEHAPWKGAVVNLLDARILALPACPTPSGAHAPTPLAPPTSFGSNATVPSAYPTPSGANAEVSSAHTTPSGANATVPLAHPTPSGSNATVPLAHPTPSGSNATVPLAHPTLSGSNATVPLAHPTPYEASKLALKASMMKTAGLFGSCLRVNAVAPGPVLLPSDLANAEPGGDVLLDHRPTPQDVAEAVAFLLEAQSVTGQILAVDSGQSLLP